VVPKNVHSKYSQLANIYKNKIIAFSEYSQTLLKVFFLFFICWYNHAKNGDAVKLIKTKKSHLILPHLPGF